MGSEVGDVGECARCLGIVFVRGKEKWIPAWMAVVM